LVKPAACRIDFASCSVLPATSGTSIVAAPVALGVTAGVGLVDALADADADADADAVADGVAAVELAGGGTTTALDEVVTSGVGLLPSSLLKR